VTWGRVDAVRTGLPGPPLDIGTAAGDDVAARGVRPAVTSPAPPGVVARAVFGMRVAVARAATTSDVFNAIAEPRRREILVLPRAGERRIAGGGATIPAYVNAGLIDEFSLVLSSVLFGAGIRRFEGVDAGRVALEPLRAQPTTGQAGIFVSGG
jgi:hypothetical protein